MSIKVVDLKINAGTTQPIILVVKNGDNAEDMTNATGKLTVGKVYQPSPSQTILVKDISVIDGLAGRIQILLTPEDTMNLDGIFLYEVSVTYKDGFKDKIVRGKFEVSPE